jgi:hypothetical protein
MPSTILACLLAATLPMSVPPGPSAPTRPTPTEKVPSYPIAWIPLHGFLGAELDETHFVTARDFDLAFDEAERLRCRHVVLDIDSPGGYSSTSRIIIRRIMEAQARGVTVIALVRTAGSGAALITMSCREILVLPDACIGAAVPLRGDASVKKEFADDPEYAAKLLSFLNAVPRGAAEQAGRPGFIVDAMVRSECELWYAPGHGLSPHRHHESARCLDDGNTVLTLTAMDVLTCGIGLQVGFDAPHDRFAHEIRDALDLPPGRSLRLDAKMQETPRRLGRLVQRLAQSGGSLPDHPESHAAPPIAPTELLERQKSIRAEIDRILETP